MTVICVDLSRYQKGFNFFQFAKSGGLGVICKATEGTTIQDSCYKDFKREALAVGLKFASYHFFRQNDPVSQADYFYDFVQPEIGERLICDFEDGGSTVGNMILFFQHLQSKSLDLQLTLYSGSTIKEQLGNNTSDWLTKNTSLWLAQYTTGNPTWPKQVWNNFSLWQYTDKGVVPGASDPLDCNIFNGSDDSFKHWMGPTVTGAPPVIAVAPTVQIMSETKTGITATTVKATVPNVSISIDSDIPVTVSLVLGEKVNLASTDRTN
jgi:lysozyme